MKKSTQFESVQFELNSPETQLIKRPKTTQNITQKVVYGTDRISLKAAPEPENSLLLITKSQIPKILSRHARRTSTIYGTVARDKLRWERETAANALPQGAVIDLEEI
ncbi:hypothetical protein SS50377_25753 [Spironucleus salmonicida]|uniref:Uncharacterized protein n=1 Tax=Spironucleus salmonicida TaxID=348837 RepID=V6LUM6_9EUKA|nr:hypothetical protein SS50377_25753 [Spironucleus salmonicida]|eukprot:EST48270.1 Hypothetical protein SS50377_11611 [Spironucleus salmonicida]